MAQSQIGLMLCVSPTHPNSKTWVTGRSGGIAAQLAFSSSSTAEDASQGCSFRTRDAAPEALYVRGIRHTVEMVRQLLVPPRDTRVQPGRDLVHAPLFAFVKAWNSAMSNG